MSQIFLWFAPIASAQLKSVFLLLNKRKAYILSYVLYLFNPLRATLYIWGSRLIGVEYSTADVSQSTGIHCSELHAIPHFRHHWHLSSDWQRSWRHALCGHVVRNFKAWWPRGSRQFRRNRSGKLLRLLRTLQVNPVNSLNQGHRWRSEKQI
jgi:hypothetical protein